MFKRCFHSTCSAWKQRNPYDVLNVKRNADKKTIKKHYYRLSKQYHPDLNPNNSEAHKRFLEINEAYAILGNEARKSQYDREEASGTGYGGTTSQSAYSAYSSAFRTGPSQAWHGRARRQQQQTGSASARAQAEGMKGSSSAHVHREQFTRYYEAEERRRRTRMSQAAERRRAAGHAGGDEHDPSRFDPSRFETWWGRLWKLGLVLGGVYAAERYNESQRRDEKTRL